MPTIHQIEYARKKAEEELKKEKAEHALYEFKKSTGQIREKRISDEYPFVIPGGILVAVVVIYMAIKTLGG